jgi:hypothetical protein
LIEQHSNNRPGPKRGQKYQEKDRREIKSLIIDIVSRGKN